MTFRNPIAEFGMEVFPREQQKPEAVTALQKAEIATWWPMLKAAKIKAE